MWPFNSVQCGKGWAGEQQLMKEWAELEWKLVHIYTTLQVNPVLSPALEEEMYPLPSKFGYTRVHHSQDIANGCLEHSRDAFYPLIGSLSYFIFFLNFPATAGPLLRWSKPRQVSLSAKRSSPNMSPPPSKRPRTKGSVEGETNPKGVMTNEGSYQEKQPIRGYEDGYYWQFLLACANCPVSAISWITESELVDFTPEYLRTGYLVRPDSRNQMSLGRIACVTKSIPVWFEWQAPYHLYTKELEDFWPSQSQIDEARHSNKGKGKVLDNGWDSWGDADIATTSGLTQTTGVTHPTTPLSTTLAK